MNQKERLVEVLNKKYDHFCDQCGVNKDSHYTDNLADYLLANGVIVPPCKVGTTVWVIPTKENGLTEITEMTVRGFAIGEPCNVANCFRVRGTSALFQPSFEQFGKTVFTSREEALSKLHASCKQVKGGCEG